MTRQERSHDRGGSLEGTLSTNSRSAWNRDDYDNETGSNVDETRDSRTGSREIIYKH